jgi:putative methyltransferase (TIGR04325 family)
MLRKLKQYIPDALKTKVKSLLNRSNLLGWSGDYSSWEKAKSKCTGYDNDVIVNKVKDAVLKVKRGEAKSERDSVVFDDIYLFDPIVKALRNSVNDNKLHVCDFGGSLGSSYFQFREQFEDIDDLKWTVVEQEHFVAIGNSEIAFEQLTFEGTIEDALKVQQNQLLLLFSVLQYIPNALEFVQKIVSYKFEYILIDRTAFIERPNNRITIQVVPPEIYEASYPCWFFNESNFLSLFLRDYELLDQFTDEFPEPMYLGAEKVYWRGFYLKRKNG